MRIRCCLGLICYLRKQDIGGISWTVFKNEFIEKYFSDDDRNKIEIEFLQLKQGSVTIVDYMDKFEELVIYSPHYNGAEAEESKCVKFESGLHPNIKQLIGYQEIHWFSVLVNKCRTYDEDSRARSAH